MVPSNPTTVPDEEEDDYMNMVIAEPVVPKVKETYTQRRLRKEREAETRGRTKSKAELEADASLAREVALSKSLLADPSTAASNKGLKMMAKMGFKPGAALGQAGNVDARTEPIGISMKDDRGGIGMDNEKKRRIREEFEGAEKRVKVDEGGFRERVRKEREDARTEAQVAAAMRVAERMAEEKEIGEETLADKECDIEMMRGDRVRKVSSKPLKSINVLWRGLVRLREEKERDRRMRHDLQQSLSRLPTYEDDDEDKDYKKAFGKDPVQRGLVEDLDEEDAELDDFTALDPQERLQKLVEYLRTRYKYCFWCKHTYPDDEMDGCPGLTEEDHD